MRKAYREISKRYINILKNIDYEFYEVKNASKNHIIGMLEMINNNDDMPIDKVARWFGFIQGVLTVNGVIDVDEERDLTRNIFQKKYKKSGESIKSISI